MKDYILEETNWHKIKNTSYEIAILPWGATEAHNYHLPYGTDTIETTYIANNAAAIASEKGCKVVVLPAIPYGVNTTQLDNPLTINFNPSTQQIILKDILDSLKPHGIKKLIILNGHGGNDFKQIIRELYPQYPNILISQIHWFQVVNPSNYFEDIGEHAGECETSMMLKIAPELVLPLKIAGDGSNKKINLAGAKEKWFWTPRNWKLVTKDTGIGNPAKATAEKGEKYLTDVVNKIASLLIDLSQKNITDLYE